MRIVDAGVRDVVARLNAIPGVCTRASCEGKGPLHTRQRHADLAYVLLWYPMPLELQDFLRTRLDPLARVEPGGVYSRWPARNGEFLARLADALQAYALPDGDRRQRARVPLARLRAQIARGLAQREAAQVGLCLICRAVIVGAHTDAHGSVRFLQVPGNQALLWFAEFIARPGDAIDPRLLAHEGVERLVMRTHRADFGAAFYRRWLRYRARRLADLATHQLRLGVDAARRQGTRIDFYFDATYACFTWDSAAAAPDPDGNRRPAEGPR